MKKALHLLAFSLFFLPTLFGQKYINETSQWFEITGDSYYSWLYFTNNQVVKDTVINNKSYYKIQQTTDWFALNPNNFDTLLLIQGGSFFWYLREDASKIYELQNGKDVLIIDFDMKIGDTLQFTYYDVIVKIDSFYFQNEFRKKYISKQEKIIYEGIGGGYSLTRPFHLPPHGFGILACYTQNGETLKMFNGPYYYPLFLGDTCIIRESVYTHLDDALIADSELKIFPNPVTTTFTIESSEPILFYSIYDALGGVIREVNVMHNKDLQCDLISENSGIYFIVAKTKNTTLTGKFMKI